MKIRVEDILPNPFRDMKQCPIQKAKVKVLRQSFKGTGVWPVLMGRKSPTEAGKVEIAFGHHRLVALTEEYGGEKEVEISVSDHTDAMMLKLMANENLEEYGHRFGVTLETVMATARFLAGDDSAQSRGSNYLKISVQEIADFLNWPHQRVSTGVRVMRLVANRDATGDQFNDLSQWAARKLAAQIESGLEAAEKRRAEMDARAENAHTAAQAERIRKVAERQEEQDKAAVRAAAKRTADDVAAGKAGVGSIGNLGYASLRGRKRLPDPTGEAKKIRAKLDNMYQDESLQQRLKDINELREHFSNQDVKLMIHGFTNLAKWAGEEAAKLAGYDAKEAKEASQASLITSDEPTAESE